MKNKKRKNQKNLVLSTERTGEELWRDLQNAPYNEEDIGKSFLILQRGRPRGMVRLGQKKERKED